MATAPEALEGAGAVLAREDLATPRRTHLVAGARGLAGPRGGDGALEVKPGALPGLAPLFALFDRLVLEIQALVKVDGLHGMGIGGVELDRVAQDLSGQPYHKFFDAGCV